MDFFEQLETEHKIKLTPQQQAAILHTEGYNLLLACPGSGKTTVMVVKTGYLMRERGIRPHQILSLTFSKASALDMKKRYEKLFGETQEAPVFSTIHSFCYKIMKQDFARKGIVRDNIEALNSRGMSKSKILAIIFEKYFKVRPNEEHIEEIAAAISYIKNLMIPTQDIRQSGLNLRFIKEIFSTYEQFKEDNRYYDYDDLLVIGHKVLQEQPEFLGKLQRQYQYLQVDEAQDNSKIQNEIIRLLVTPENNLFMVADDDQTIYEWRGAYPEGILTFEKQYEGAKVFRMEQNFRSSQDIVSISNLFIQHNKNRYEKNLMTANPGYLPIEVQHFQTYVEQYKFITQSIKNKNRQLFKSAILYRNNLSVILLADLLEQEGVSFSTRGYNGNFFNHWVLSDIKSFLLFAYEPDRLEHFDRIYYKNETFISKKLLEKAKLGMKKRKSIFDALLQIDAPQYNQRKKILELKHGFKLLAHKPMGQAIDYILKEMGYGQWIKNAASKSDGGKNVLTILKGISEHCRNPYELFERLDYLKEKLQNSTQQKNPHGVVLSTVHSAKGLEFETVYMVDLMQGIFPADDTLTNTKLLEAERRLFYVGMTRAKYQLHLLSVSEKANRKIPSIFVKEIESLLNPTSPNQL